MLFRSGDLAGSEDRREHPRRYRGEGEGSGHPQDGADSRRGFPRRSIQSVETLRSGIQPRIPKGQPINGEQVGGGRREPGRREDRFAGQARPGGPGRQK